MKKLSFGYKIIFILNNVFAILLLLAYLTTFISPKSFPISAILNFSIPVLWIINFCFVLIWLFKLKKQIFLSLIVIALGWFQLHKFFVFTKPADAKNNGLKVMSYNVMQFYSKEDKRKSTYEDIYEFVSQESPSILCMQEFKYLNTSMFPKHKYKVTDTTRTSLQTVIYSKYPFVNQKFYEFVSNNSAVMADVAVDNDTLRVFSIHFESLNLKPSINQIQEERKDLLLKRLERSFLRQIDQFELMKDDIKNSPYPVVLCADMNNTALSYLYRQIVDENLKDSFIESGRFYGKTFNFIILPVRIDMIFIDENLKSTDFKNYKIKHSDHFPVMTQIHL